MNDKIIFIKGNHDKSNSLKAIIRHLKVDFGDYRINMVHRPQDISWECDFNLVGHVHDNWKTKVATKINYCDPDKPLKMLMINVGVDVHKFKPVKLVEAIGIYEKEKRKGALK